MGEELVLRFEDIGRGDINRVGGKCANLGEMVKVGIPVPPGFAVTTTAYDNFIEETGALKEMEEYLKKFPEGPRTLAEFEEVSQTIGQFLMSKQIPAYLKDGISEAYNDLCLRCGQADLPVAVRSSGVAEDMPGASFAGQYESYLNVRGKEDVLDKVKECWASMFSTRCVSYRRKHALGVLGSSISVAIMKMVHPRSAGVGFTVHPSTGDDTRVVLEGNWGVGEAVVQGIVTPDTYIIDKKKLELEEKRISEKLRRIVYNEKGTVETDVPTEIRSVPCLGEKEAIKIAEYARTLELHYGVPQDIEWAIDMDLQFPDNTFLVQCRPVTVIHEKKSPTDHLLDMLMNRWSS